MWPSFTRAKSQIISKENMAHFGRHPECAMFSLLIIWLFALVKLGHIYFFVFRPDDFTRRVLGVIISQQDGRAEYQTFQAGTYLSEVLFVLWAAYVNGTVRVALMFIVLYLGFIVGLRIVFLIRYKTFGPMHRSALSVEIPGLVGAAFCLLTGY